MKSVFAVVACLLAVSLAQNYVGQGHYCDPTNSFCLDWNYGKLVIISIYFVGNNLNVNLFITARGLPVGNTGYVAIGFNDKFQMIGADALVSWVLPNTNVPVISCRRLFAKDPAQVTVSFNPCYASAINGTSITFLSLYSYIVESFDYQNGTAYIAITRPVTFFNKGGIGSIQAITGNSFQTVIWSIGSTVPANPTDNLVMHTTRGLFAANFGTVRILRREI
jgi:hypothetical protein